jgi:uncharacterized repeat protein (TIGR03803 family)
LAPQQSPVRNDYHILHTFGKGQGDGTHSSADLIDVKGVLYGTTSSGGSHDAGTVFSITTSGQETVLHSFGGPGDGVEPTARLLNVNGTLYGTTSEGGYNYGGTVFSMSLDGRTEKVLHSFDDPYTTPEKGGATPKAGLIYLKGMLYGTTSQGGAVVCGGDGYYCGTVFAISTGGKFKVLYSFGRKGPDGESPVAALLDLNGTLYGTTLLGGKYENGTVFSISTAGEERTVYSFGGGSNPASALIDVQGTLYGTTSGNGGGGTVFSVTTDGTEEVLHTFGGSDGSVPLADLKNVKGVLYGTTSMGGMRNVGTVFSITKNGKYTVLHSFTDGTSQQPRAGLAIIGGALYGTTFGTVIGNSKKYGTVFSLTP